MKNATKLATEYQTALETIWAAEKYIIRLAQKVPLRTIECNGWKSEMQLVSLILRTAEKSEKALRKEMDVHPTAWDKNVKVKVTI